MSILDIFKGFQAPAPAPAAGTPSSQQTPAAPGNIPADAGASSAAGNPNVPAGSADAAASPLDKFNDLWKNDPNAASTAPQPMFNIDPEKVAAAAKANDFSKVITPDLRAQIEAGGAEATQALMQVMNSMSQKSFGDSTMATANIVEAALKKQMDSFKEMLPGLVKQQNLKESLATDNPIFNHPATTPILESLRQQVATKFPNASVSEQKQMAMDYLQSFASQLAPKPAASAASKADTDWSEFLK